nr:MAG TPA: Pre-mRNA splicing factor PRP21 like protein [Caudoviricetes sp.]
MNRMNRCRICGKLINLEDFDINREIPKLMKAQDDE